MVTRIEEARKAGDSVGGIVAAVVRGCQPGLGEPVGRAQAARRT